MIPESRPRILVVDDNEALVDNLKEILEEAGHQVVTAGTCERARALSADRFDVALIDLMLPDGEGTSLAQTLRGLQPDSEVVLLTGHASLESAAAAVRAGACAYLLKPCPAPELILTVSQALRQVTLQREKRELARRAQTAEKLAAIGTLTAGLTHEIRNPLNAAGLQLAVLERRVRRLGESEQQGLLEPLALVRDEIRRLDHILQDFLQFARPREFEPRAVEVEWLLSGVLDLLEGDAERRGVRLERDYAGAPLVRGDEGRLRQVVMNLALNALDAMPSGGLMRVSTVSEAGMLCIVVEDSGPGIPDEHRSRLFEPFFTTKANGSGLGLAIVHAIVSQHGGSVVVERSRFGGARFELRLPT